MMARCGAAYVAASSTEASPQPPRPQPLSL
jgi:hypothetical protein